MAYFSNGMEGECYQATWCSKCRNWKKDECGIGCPIWDLHITYAYDLCNSKSKAKIMLDRLIPEKDYSATTCSMFLKK